MKKRALATADRIELAIHRSGWPVGSSVGDESALMVEHQVGRSVLRQAVRIVEHLGVATSRRGRNGGLIVSHPGPAPAALTLRIGWSKDATPARSVGQLKSVVDDWTTDGPEGAHIVQDVVTLAHDAFNDELVVGPRSDRLKLGEQTATAIVAEMTARRWNSIELLGSENELMERHGAGRAALREAVHLLELHGAAVMQRGPGGGLLMLRASSSGAIPRSLRAQFRAAHLGRTAIEDLVGSLLDVLPTDEALPAARAIRLAATQLGSMV